jgi:hypothetical protein
LKIARWVTADAKRSDWRSVSADVCLANPTKMNA